MVFDNFFKMRPLKLVIAVVVVKSMLLNVLMVYGHQKSTNVDTTSLSILMNNTPPQRVTYKKINGAEVQLFYKKPLSNGKHRLLPAIIWVHGGGWVAGDASIFFPYVNII